MSVLNRPKLPTDNVQVWDGYRYAIVTREEAERLVGLGTHQLTENLQASQLKRPQDFKPVETKVVEPEPKDQPPLKVDGRSDAKTYKNRMLKAEE
jgi:hypothetical protein